MSDITKDKIILNTNSIKKEIEKSCLKVNRKRDDVELIAVSKKVDTDLVNIALECGIKSFAENRVKEFTRKYDIIKEDINWHYIGRIQTNKIKYIIGKTKLIHSMDRVNLAIELDKYAKKHSIDVDVLLQVNVSSEESKAGVSGSEVYEILKEISKLGNIKVKGLMTMAPYTTDVEETRWVFRELRKIFLDIRNKKLDNISMQHLSMGMSNDYKIAIEEGATMVRIGTKIFS